MVGKSKKPSGNKIRHWKDSTGYDCVGNDCLQIRRKGKDVRIEILKDKCERGTSEAFSKILTETIMQGGSTYYRVRDSRE